MDSPLPLPFVLLGLLPVVISVVRGRQAHDPPRRLIADAIPKAWLAVLLLAFVLPRASSGAHVVLVVGVFLALWGTWIDIQSYRRQKKGEPRSS
jgi:hypothetical protein